MRSALIFILSIYFVCLKGLSSEPAAKSTFGRFPPDASQIKAKLTGKKHSNHQIRRSTTADPFENGEFSLNQLETHDMSYEDYDIPGESPYFPNYDLYGDGQHHIKPHNFHQMVEIPESDYGDELSASDLEDEYDLPDRKRGNKKAVSRQAQISDEKKGLPLLVRKAKHPAHESGFHPVRNSRFKYRGGGFKRKGKGWKNKKYPKNENLPDEKAMSKNLFRKKTFNRGPAYYDRKKKPWKERTRLSSKKYRINRPENKWSNSREKMPEKELKPFKKHSKPRKFKWNESKDTNDFNNRLFKKSINESSPEGITDFPTETAASVIRELPTAVSTLSKRSDQVKSQAEDYDQELTEEPPNDLKPGAFRAEMFHERVVRNGSAGSEDNLISKNEKLPLEKRQATTSNPVRRRRKHIDDDYAIKQFFQNEKRRLVKKDVNTSFSNTSISPYVPTPATPTVIETTYLYPPTTVIETEPPITGETEAPTTLMVHKRFVASRDRNQSGDNEEEISKRSNQQLENLYEQRGMHLIKLIYRIKEQELESIFDTLNMSTSTETGAGLTNPNLEDVIRKQSSMIKRLVKAIDEKQNRQANNSKVFNGVKKRFKNHGSETVGTSNPNEDNSQNPIQHHKSKHNQGSSDNTKPQNPISSKPATEIIIKNLLKNPSFLQQLMSRNSKKNVDKDSLISPSMLQLMATSLKDADEVEKDEVIDKDKGAPEKTVLRENQSLDGKLTKTIGDNSKVPTTRDQSVDEKLTKIIGDNSIATAAGNGEKAFQFDKSLPTTPKAEEKKLNAEKIKQILIEMLKNPSIVRRSNVNRRRARDSLLKSKQLIARSSELTTPATYQASSSAFDSEGAIGKGDSIISDQYSNAQDITTEEMDVEYEDESTSNSYVLTKSSRSATSGTEESEDVYDDSSTQEGDESIEGETLTENDTTVTTEHS